MASFVLTEAKRYLWLYTSTKGASTDVAEAVTLIRDLVVELEKHEPAPSKKKPKARAK